MINPSRFVRLSNALSKASPRMFSSKVDLTKESVSLRSPKVYNVPPRFPTMDDLMEPYGPWKQAYAAENKRANFAVIRGACALLFAITVFLNSGVTDGLYMPNLDNIMEETESFHVDKTDRVTV